MTLQFSLSFRNAELVRMGWQNLSAEIPKIPRKPIYDTQLAIIRRNKEYPNRSTTYKRTYRFRAGWSLEAYDLGYRIRNKMSYSRFVVGNAYGQGQAWMHVGTWRLFRDIADEEVAKLPEAIQNELSLAVRRNNLA
jgi:hypothetical protein